MNPATTIAALARAASLLQAAAGDDDVRQVGNALAAWLAAKDAITFDSFIGLAPGQSERHWRTSHALHSRDDLLRRAAAEFFPLPNASRQAEDISRDFNGYRNSAWDRADRKLAECPTRYIGTKREFWWRILKLHDRPLSVDRIRKILGTSNRVSCPTNSGK